MNKSRIISITFLVLFHIMLVSAFVTHINDSSTYALFAIYLFLVFIWAINFRNTRRRKKILDAVSAEHKLYGANVTVLQTGYVRMRVDSVAAGAFSFKSHLQLIVNVPSGTDAQATKATIVKINEITETLHSEELLVSCRFGVNAVDDDKDDDNNNNSQRVFPLYIVVNEKITAERFRQLYDSLLKAIMDNGCNDIEHFTITGIDTGTIYKHYRGNLCVGTIEYINDSHVFFNSAIDRSIYFGIDELEHTEKQYKALRDSIRESDLNLTLDEAAKYIKQILKKTGKGIRVSMFKEKNHLSISISNRNSSVNLHIINQNGLWWIYSYGNMMQVPILSTESETEATRMMVRLVTNINNKLRNM